jgi:hypothetical protein
MNNIPGNIVDTWKVWAQFVTIVYSISKDSGTIDMVLLLVGAWTKLTGPCIFIFLLLFIP